MGCSPSHVYEGDDITVKILPLQQQLIFKRNMDPTPKLILSLEHIVEVSTSANVLMTDWKYQGYYFRTLVYFYKSHCNYCMPNVRDGALAIKACRAIRNELKLKCHLPVLQSELVMFCDLSKSVDEVIRQHEKYKEDRKIESEMRKIESEMKKDIEIKWAWYLPDNPNRDYTWFTEKIGYNPCWYGKFIDKFVGKYGGSHDNYAMFTRYNKWERFEDISSRSIEFFAGTDHHVLIQKY